jgi:phospholipid transport system substrate-binding protein
MRRRTGGTVAASFACVPERERLYEFRLSRRPRIRDVLRIAVPLCDFARDCPLQRGDNAMSTFIRFLRRAAAALASAAALPAAAERAHVEAIDGTAFVREVGGAMLGLPGDTAARESRLRAIYRAKFDAEAIAAGVAGRAWRGAPQGRRAAFTELLERYFATALAARLAEIAEAKFDVTMSEPEGDGLVVYSRIESRERSLAVNVRWRLTKHGGEFRIRDLVVENVSVALYLRRELRGADAVRDDGLDAMAERLASLIAGGKPALPASAR